MSCRCNSQQRLRPTSRRSNWSSSPQLRPFIHAADEAFWLIGNLVRPQHAAITVCARRDQSNVGRPASRVSFQSATDKRPNLLSIICQNLPMATSAVPALFAAIESIVGYDGNGTPPGAFSRVQRIADLLKYEHAPLAAFAEQTAIDLHLFRNATLQGDARALGMKSKLATAWWQHVASTPITMAGSS